MVKFIVMDVDGTLTDGKIYMGNSGELFKAFDIKDGCGIKDILPQYGIIPIIITARESELLKIRANELGIRHIYQGIRNKFEKLEEVIASIGKESGEQYSLCDVAYIGDDILDLKCMLPIQQNGGIIGCPSDAVDEIIEIADYKCAKKAGEGAVREFIEYLIKDCIDESNLEKRIDDAIAYIQKLELDKIALGKYEVNDKFYYMVQSYRTKNDEDCKLESHKEYVDIQWIISGEEKIGYTSINQLKVLEEYDKNKDVVFYSKTKHLGEIILRNNSYAIFYPEMAHMPCCCVNNTIGEVFKIVAKIKV